MSEHRKHSGRTPPADTFNASTNTRKLEPNKFCTQTTGPSGELTVSYCSADGNSAGIDYASKIESTGTIRTYEYESNTRNSMSVNSEVGSKRTQQKNECNTTDGNSDYNTLGCNKCTTEKEKGCETGNNSSTAVGGTCTNITKGPYNNITLPGSKNNRNIITSGNINKKHTGSETISVEGDYFHSTGESRYDIVKNGEYGINVQSGNMDVQLDSGKARISAAQEILLICGSSYVKILPNRIEIVADRIDLNP